jgi:hypothetical protein
MAYPSRLLKIEAVAGHFVVRRKGESRKQPSGRLRPLSGAGRIPPRPTNDILFHGVLPNADIQRIDLDNPGDDQLATNGHSVAPADLYAILYQRHSAHFTSLECPAIRPDAPFSTVDALEDVAAKSSPTAATHTSARSLCWLRIYLSVDNCFSARFPA